MTEEPSSSHIQTSKLETPSSSTLPPRTSTVLSSSSTEPLLCLPEETTSEESVSSTPSKSISDPTISVTLETPEALSSPPDSATCSSSVTARPHPSLFQRVKVSDLPSSKPGTPDTVLRKKLKKTNYSLVFISYNE